MALDPSITADPNAGGNDGGASSEGTQPAAPAAPAERTYTKSEYDSSFANARRAWQYETEQKLARERAAWERQSKQPQVQPNDPWSAFDPQVAQTLRAALERELENRVAPLNQKLATYQQQQDDLAFANNEANLRQRFPDYSKNRDDVLRFAIANGIQNLEHAYRSWKFEELSKIDLEAERKKAVADYTRRKTAQSVSTPASEGRGGGAPSSKQELKTPEDRDRLVAEIFRNADTA